MKFVQEFKKFAMRGNVVDMATGVIIGGAFGKIVSSLVADVIMPVLGILTGGVDFKDLNIVLKHAGENSAAVTLNYGSFIQTVFDFLIIAFSIFMMIKLINRLKSSKEEEKVENSPKQPPKPSAEEALLMEIRDLLKRNTSQSSTVTKTPSGD